MCEFEGGSATLAPRRLGWHSAATPGLQRAPRLPRLREQRQPLHAARLPCHGSGPAYTGCTDGSRPCLALRRSDILLLPAAAAASPQLPFPGALDPAGRG